VTGSEPSATIVGPVTQRVDGEEDRVVAIDPEAATPPYEQVRAQLATRIADGSLPVGTRLPTVRALAAELHLATNTVARAYRELEAAGLVETQGRRGTFVSATRSDTLQQAQDAARVYAETIHALGLSAGEAVALVTAAVDPASAWRGRIERPDLQRGE
jgi:DNA-binding transcriptional regulator YhcF (GntR family)